ncbi:MAG: hypothetical protein HYY16_00895 [Planctomycetes bacterium]|nr:hypothetical protein [Planctomycetota bacterium]
MSVLLLIGVLALGQDDVGPLVERIDETDPAATFDAISRLVDLAAAGADVQAAAEKLPAHLAFYRTAILEELSARDRLGARFPAETRVSIDVTDLNPHDVLRQIAERSKEPIDLGRALLAGIQTPVTLKRKDAPVLALLSELCRKTNLRICMYGGLPTVYRGGGDSPVFQYRNFLLTLSSVQRTRRVRFGLKESRSLLLTLDLVCDSKANVVGRCPLEWAQAVDDQGRVVPMSEEDEPSADDDPPIVNATPPAAVTISLKLPEQGASKLSRLRGAFIARMPAEASRFVLLDLQSGASQADEHFAVELDRIHSANRQISATLRVRPKGPVQDFVRMPMEIRIRTRDGTERLCAGTGRDVEGAVEYVMIRNLMSEDSPAGPAQEPESISILIHRATVERKVHFELTDITLN